MSAEPDIAPDIPEVETPQPPAQEPIPVSPQPDIDLRALAAEAFAGILDALTDRLQSLPASSCAACGKPFLHDQTVTLVPLGPGDDADARAAAAAGQTYSARAVPVHRSCATGQETS